MVHFGRGYKIMVLRDCFCVLYKWFFYFLLISVSVLVSVGLVRDYNKQQFYEI